METYILNSEKITPRRLGDSFPGLPEALKGFEKIDRLTYVRDPQVNGVFLFKGEFRDGRYGLFIWSNFRKEFIEEPATLADFDIRSIADLYKKYPGLKPSKAY